VTKYQAFLRFYEENQLKKYCRFSMIFSSISSKTDGGFGFQERDCASYIVRILYVP